MNKNAFLGQVAVKQNGKWYGRKLVKKNFHTFGECVSIANKLAYKRTPEVHVSIFFSRDPFDENADVFGDFLIDLDGESKEQLKAVREEASDIAIWLANSKIPFRVSFTSHRGFKIYVPFEAFGIEPTPILPILYKQFAEFISLTVDAQFIDMQVYQLRHMNRWDNTIHEKTGLFQVPISFDELTGKMDNAFLFSIAMEQRFDAPVMEFPVPVPYLSSLAQKIRKQLEDKEREMKERQKHAEEIVQSEISDDELMRKLRPCVLSAYTHGAEVGKRNLTAFIIATEFRHLGIPKGEALQKIKKWNILNKQLLPLREITATVNSAYKPGSSYSYGCNNPILAENCPFPDRKMCTFYREFAHIDVEEKGEKLPIKKEREVKDKGKPKKRIKL